MRLMTKELEKRFAQLGSTTDVEDPIIVTKFFNPFGIGTWYPIEYDSKEKMFFGWRSIFGGPKNEEGWGCFSLGELESYENDFDPGIHRDVFWTEKKVSSVIH